ncbi:MAG: helix-turn-helix transcriptional regulator [Methanomicrobiales archaeon]|nr:helix-turn-helix transcriptional regulator [Methanomicrobiales archaeon]
MAEESLQVCLCPLEGVIDTISKKWALLIINILGNHGRLRFNELMSGLEGISPKTLTDTLRLLQEEELIRRDAFAEIPPRVEYSLTADGGELLAAIRPLLQWAAKREDFSGEGCSSSCRKGPGHHGRRRGHSENARN